MTLSIPDGSSHRTAADTRNVATGWMATHEVLGLLTGTSHQDRPPVRCGVAETRTRPSRYILLIEASWSMEVIELVAHVIGLPLNFTWKLKLKPF